MAPRQGRGARDSSQNNSINSTTLPPLPQQDNVRLNRAEQIRQVDSWRSYRSDTVNLQSSIYPQAGQQVQQPLGHTDPLAHASTQFQGLNIHAPAFTPYQPLRVSDGTREGQVLQQAPLGPRTNATARYSFRTRRLDQITPYSNGTVDTLRSPHERGDDFAHYGSYNLSRSQINSSDVLTADQIVPSVETGYTLLGTSAALMPSSLPPRFGDRRSYSRTPENVAPPKPPKTTSKYLKHAAKAPETIPSAKKLLVILDLNGTLLVRPNGRADPTKFKLRPGVTQLLDYLFKNHVVMVYSSARPENVLAIINKLFHPKQRAQLAAVWARDKLDLSNAQYRTKVQVYKKLDKIWANSSIQASAGHGQKWDQSNTILVDDSHLKALAQPHNLVQVPEFENNAPREGGEPLRNWQLGQQEILKSLEQKLEELKWQVDVSRLIREWQAGVRHAPGVVDETIDQKTHQNIEEQTRAVTPTPIVGQSDTAVDPEQIPYLSPKSLSSSLSVNQEYRSEKEQPASPDIIEQEINQGLQNTSLSNDDSDRAARRSESPIEESVFAKLLSGRHMKDDNEKGRKEKMTTLDVPPTPESMSG